MKLSKEQIQEMKSMEGRDLMWFLLDMWDNSLIDGDNITQFLTDHISDEAVKEYIEEVNND
tara:strand:+ start:165 stop:347 length:183 start_codon:yes stop_codon:yes gene_type:complete